MNPDEIFPKHVPQRLEAQTVVGVLHGLSRQGFTVSRLPRENTFLIELTDHLSIRLSPFEAGFQIQGLRGDFPQYLENVTSEQALVNVLGQITRAFLGVDVNSYRPQTLRLTRGRPATNMSKIMQLIGSNKITAVFDPYLDNAGLQTLTDITSLAPELAIASTIKLLSSSGVLSRNPPRLTKSFVDKWLVEHSASDGEFKLTSGEHRRFMLLSNGQTLVLGLSLNNLDQNEAAHLENNPEDKEFFDAQWAAGEQLQSESENTGA